MKEHYFRFAIGLKEGKVAVKFRFSVTVVDGVHNHNFSLRQWAHNDTRGWIANLQEIGFQMFTVTCVSVSRVSRWHTSKMYKVAFKVRYTYYYEHFLSLFFRKVPSNHRRCLEWKLSRYIKGLYLRLSNNEFLDPVFQQHRNFIQTPYEWRKIVPWNRVILQCRI